VVEAEDYRMSMRLKFPGHEKSSVREAGRKKHGNKRKMNDIPFSSNGLDIGS
jgi:hypothetical protein